MLENEVKLKEEVRDSYIDYAMSVIARRALPDVRDGLKPVQRRILWDMRELNLTPDKPHRKSARIVGDTMGKYHPHGDSAIYEALVCMSRSWSSRYPLIDGHGNFGSRDGDGAAAMRYTEARLSKNALEMLTDINKNTIDFIPNYDESEEEPSVLPSRLPNIFLGGSGIAVGMASKIAPYNLNEIVAGLTAYLMNPNITMQEMISYVPAPDFPTGGSIINQSDMLEVMSKGQGKIIVRADYHIEENKNKKLLVFTEVPYEVNKSRLIESIVEKVNSNDLFGISDVRDESGKEIRIVVELKKNVIPEAIAQQLFLKTDFQVNFNLNNTVILNGKPVRHMSFLQMVREYCSFQIEVLNRRTSFEKRECEKRLNIVNGLLLALENIDRVVEIIRGSQTPDEARETLKEEFNLNNDQSSVILEMKLKKLVGLEKIKLEGERENLIGEINRLQHLLDNPSEMRDLLIRELNDMGRRLGDERRTKLLNISNNGKEGELVLVPAEDVVVLLDGAGYIKTVKTSDYRIQGRGGQGIKNKGEEAYKNVVKTNTLDSLLILTKKGVMFKLPVRNIPQGRAANKGISIHNLLSNIQDDSVGFILNIKEMRNYSSIIFVTKKGIVKKSSTDLYSNFRSNGSKGIVLREGDEVVDVLFCNDNDLITLFASNGKSCTFLNDTLSSIGRVGQGVRGILLGEEDRVVGCAATPVGEEVAAAIFSENGYGKKISTSQLPVQGRGGKGLFYYKTTDKTGCVASVIAIPKNNGKDVNNILLIGDNNSMAIEDNLPIQGRNTLGVIVMRGSKILSAVIL